jgi:hypothetical protein
LTEKEVKPIVNKKGMGSGSGEEPPPPPPPHDESRSNINKKYIFFTNLVYQC